MGTRHLVMVASGGQMKVAQYGQFDGYPSAAGAEILDFIKGADLVKFKEMVDKLEFYAEEEVDGILSGGEACLLTHPWLDRENSRAVLTFVYEGLTNKLYNSEDFARDGLFCEWGYLLDLDNNILEVYKGFSKNPVPDNERFAKYNESGMKYYPIKLIKTYDFENLPSSKTLVLECDVDSAADEDD